MRESRFNGLVWRKYEFIEAFDEKTVLQNSIKFSK